MIERKVYTNNQLTGERLWMGMQFVALSPQRRHHFPIKTFDEYVSRGFISVDGDDLTYHCVDGDLKFTIDHRPGRVCLHCGEKLPDEPEDAPMSKQGEQARKHVADKHAGELSPNPSYPAGYKNKRYYGATPDDSVPMVNPKASKYINALRG